MKWTHQDFAHFTDEETEAQGSKPLRADIGRPGVGTMMLTSKCGFIKTSFASQHQGLEVSTFLEGSENKTKKFWKTHFALINAVAQQP